MAAAVAVAGALLGACDSGDSAARATVNKVTLEPADLPPDWTHAAAPDPVGAEGDESRYGACVGRPDPKTVRTATRSSDEFRHGDELRVMSTVRTLPGKADAKADLAALAGNRAGPCLRQRVLDELNRRSAAGKTPQRVTVERIPGLAFGDETAAFRATLTYSGDDAGQKTTLVDVVNVRKGSVELVVTFTSVQQPFPVDLQKDVMTRVVGRI